MSSQQQDLSAAALAQLMQLGTLLILAAICISLLCSELRGTRPGPAVRGRQARRERVRGEMPRLDSPAVRGRQARRERVRGEMQARRERFRGEMAREMEHFLHPDWTTHLIELLILALLIQVGILVIRTLWSAFEQGLVKL